MRSTSTALTLVVALGLSAMAFWPIVDVGFHTDDWVHLYDIVNEGPARFVIKNYFGHLQLTRNAVFLLFHALFGLHPGPYMWAMLLTHLVSVALLVLVVLRLTGNAAVAGLVAALWGTSPFHVEVLGWYSVYGQALATACVLWVALQLVRVAVDGHFPARRVPWSWTIALLAASTSFGSGFAMALAMPAFAWLALPPSADRRRLVAGLAAVAAACAALYVFVDLVDTRVFRVPSAILMGPSDSRSASKFLQFVLRLFAAGNATWMPMVFGGREPPRGTAALLAVTAYGAVLAVGWAFMRTRERRWTTASLVLALVPYAMIALGRAAFATDIDRAIALGGRYHYAPTVGLGLALAVALAAIWRAAGGWRWLCLAGFAVWSAALVAGRVWTRVPIPRFDDQQLMVARVLNQVRAAVAAAPPGADVFVDNGDFMFSFLPLSVHVGRADIPIRYPGWAAVFAVHYPSDVVDGRHVYFVVDDPQRLAQWRRGRRGSSLLVSPAERRERQQTGG